MTYQYSLHIEAPVARVFGFFRDPGSWAALEPEGVAFHDVRVTRGGVGTHYCWTARVAGIRLEGLNVFTEFTPERLITDRSSSSLEGTWTYTFEPEGTGTRLTVRNELGPIWRQPVLERLLDRAAGRTHEPRFARLKQMLEQ